MRVNARKLCLMAGAGLVLVGTTCLSFSAAAAPIPLPALKQDVGDAPELLEPVKQRDEAEEDRVAASALFAHGRLLFQREQYDAALRRYQRAYRYDPSALHVLGEIVPLAFELDRNEEAARYAVIAAERGSEDPLLLRRLAMHLSEQQDYARALKLYEKSIELQKQPDQVSVLLLHLEMGRLKFLEEDYAGAAKSFVRVREAIDDPKKFGLSPELQQILIGNASATYSLLGESFLQVGQYDDALAMFERAQAAKSDPPQFALRSARVAAGRKQYDEALQRLDDYFASKSTAGGDEPYKLLGEVLAAKSATPQEGKTALLARLNALHAANRENLPLATALARELKSSGDAAQATTVLAAATEKELSASALKLLIELYQAQQKVPELLGVLGRSVGRSGSLEVLEGVAEGLLKDGPLVEKLIAAAREKRRTAAESLAPGEALAVALLAMESKSFDAADELFAIVAARPPAARNTISKSDIMLAWGIAHLEAEQYARAARVFREAIADRPGKERNELLHYFLAGALEIQNQTDEALAVIDKLYTPDQSSARLISRRAWVQYHAKRYPEAEKDYQTLLKRFAKDHKSPGIRQTLREARLVLSNICVLTDRRPEAIEWLEQVLDEFPEDVGAMNDLGYLWAEAGERPKRALAMTQFAVSKEPENAAYRDSLGWAYYQRGEYEKARNELEKAAELYRKEDSKGPDGVILDHLGDCYFKLNETAKALEHWQQAATAFEKEKDDERLKATRDKIAQHEQR